MRERGNVVGLERRARTEGGAGDGVQSDVEVQDAARLWSILPL
jgi:hypothetical protein